MINVYCRLIEVNVAAAARKHLSYLKGNGIVSSELHGQAGSMECFQSDWFNSVNVSLIRLCGLVKGQLYEFDFLEESQLQINLRHLTTLVLVSL